MPGAIYAVYFLFLVPPSRAIYCNVEPSFELFDHTADIGIRSRAGTLPDLVKIAGEGLYAIIGELVPGGQAQQVSVELNNAEPAVLLRDYLDELLVLFDRDHRLATSVQVATFDPGRLFATLETQVVDRDRSIYHHEVKAITYHELKIREIPDGFEATFIVDI